MVRAALRRLLLRLHGRLRLLRYSLLSDVASVEGRATFVQPALLSGRGRIVFGRGVVLGTTRSPGYWGGYCYLEARHPSALIRLGDGVWTNNNLAIVCNASQVVIGNDVLLGWAVEISDCDFHPIDPRLRKEESAPSEPVVIRDRVWIGARVTVLKGVEIGENSIVAAGAVVSRSIPANVIAAGVPARVVAGIGAR
jgi:hypothetical protein